MLTPELLTECQRLAFAVAPELTDSPLYFVDAADVGDSAGACGYVGEYAIHPAVRAAIAEWQGNGPAVVLDGANIAESYPELDFSAAVKLVAIHELAHVLPSRPILGPLALPAGDLPSAKVALCKSLEAAAQTGPLTDDAHDDRFVRRLCHLGFRAVAAGWNLPLERLPLGQWIVAWPGHWLVALLPEILRMQTASFREIEAAEPPATFSQMWQGQLSLFTPRE